MTHGDDPEAPSPAGFGDGPPPLDARPTVIRLGQFLKFAGLVSSGGDAKVRIAEGHVLVNGAVETQRRRQLKNGDVVEVYDARAVVDLPEPHVS